MKSVFLDTLAAALNAAQAGIVRPGQFEQPRALLVSVTVANPAGGYCQQPLFLIASDGAGLLKVLRKAWGLVGSLRAAHTGSALGYVPTSAGAMFRGYDVKKIDAYDLGLAYEVATSDVLRQTAASWNPADQLPDSPEYDADQVALWASYADRLNN